MLTITSKLNRIQSCKLRLFLQLNRCASSHPQASPPQPDEANRWVALRTHTTKYTTLEDLLAFVNRSRNQLESIDKLPKNENDSDTTTSPETVILDARINLSPYKQFRGWYLGFPSASMARPYIRLWRQQDGWNNQGLPMDIVPSIQKKMNKAYVVKEPNDMKNLMLAEELNLGNHVLRMDDVPIEVTPNDIYFLLRDYELMTTQRHPPIISIRQFLIEENKREKKRINFHPHANAFLIYMKDASNARAVLRDLQSCDVMGSNVVIYRYPQQLISAASLDNEDVYAT